MHSKTTRGGAFEIPDQSAPWRYFKHIGLTSRKVLRASKVEERSQKFCWIFWKLFQLDILRFDLRFRPFLSKLHLYAQSISKILFDQGFQTHHLLWSSNAWISLKTKKNTFFLYFLKNSSKFWDLTRDFVHFLTELLDFRGPWKLFLRSKLYV